MAKPKPASKSKSPDFVAIALEASAIASGRDGQPSSPAAAVAALTSMTSAHSAIAPAAQPLGSKAYVAERKRARHWVGRVTRMASCSSS